MSEDVLSPETGKDMMMMARERQLDELEAEWMRRLENAPEDFTELFVVADYLVRKKLEEHAALLLWSLVMSVAENRPLDEALQIARRAVSIAPEAKSLREEVANLYRRANPDVAEWDQIVETSGLLSGASPKDALHVIEQCLRLRPGSYVIHVRSRRLGRVIGFEEGSFRIESERLEQTLTPQNVLTHWEPLPEEDFRALAAFQPERLRVMAEDDPVKLIRLLLETCAGRAEFKQIKSMLIPTVIPAGQWSAWWNSVKVALKRSPNLEMGFGTQPTLALRAGDHSFADKLRTAFHDEADPFAKVKQIMDYLAETDAGHDADPELAADLGGECLALAKSAEAPAALALLTAAWEIHSRFSNVPDASPALSEQASQMDAPGPAILAIPNDDLSRAVLNALRSVRPDDWPTLFADVFPYGSLRMCEWIARDLKQANREDLLLQAAQQALGAPENFAEAFGWTWRWALGGEGRIEGRSDVSLTANLLEVMHRMARAPKHLGRRTETRQALSKLRAILSGGDFKLIRNLAAATDVQEARRLYDAARNNEGLTDEARHEIMTLLRERHPKEFVERQPLWADGFIHTSAEGLARRQAELEKLTHEDIPRNAIAIGKAASLGDLRENWEYKSALEERDRLVERATRAREDVERARVIDPSEIGEDIVNVGTAATIRAVAGGKEKRLVFLGPWDSDIPKGIYSYQAPLSQGFMGKHIGERVEAQFDDANGSFEIIRIEKIV